MPFNGSLKTLGMRVIEAVIIGILVAAVTVYAQTIRQGVINDTFSAGITKIELRLEKLSDQLVSHMIESNNQVKEIRQDQIRRSKREQ